MRRALVLIAIVIFAGLGWMAWNLGHGSVDDDPVAATPDREAGNDTAVADDEAESAAATHNEGTSLVAMAASFAPSLSEAAATVPVEGRVVDARSKRGVGNVEIYFGSRSSVVAGTDGSFHLQLPPGAYKIMAAGANVISTKHQRAFVKAGMKPLVVSVDKTAVVRGRMTAGGIALTDATISFETLTGDDKVQGLSLVGGVGQAFTGQDGTYQLQVVPGRVTIIGRSPAGRAESDERIMKAGHTYEVNLTAAAPVEIHGRVTNSQGESVVGATVHLHPYGHYVASADFRVAITDDGGNYVIKDAYAGQLAIEAYAIGKGHAPATKMAIESGKTYERDLRLRAPQSITGQVSFEGHGIATRVRAHRTMGRIDIETMSDATGRFELNDLAGGPYTLQAYRPDGSARITPMIDCPASGVVIDLDRR